MTDEPTERPAREPVDVNKFAMAAVGCGMVGLIVFQIVLGPLAVVLASAGFHRAGGEPIARRFAMIGYGLGVFDAVLWLVLQAGFGITPFPF